MLYALKGMKQETFSKRNIKGIITRPLYASKGNAGSVLVILGSDQFIGAGILAAQAALRAGTDIVGVAAPESAALTINAYAPDLITHKLAGARISRDTLPLLRDLIERYTTVLIGPGADLGEGLEKELIREIANKKKALVLDAQSTHAVMLEEVEEVIFLPNKSEFEKLIAFNNLQKTIEDVRANNEKAAKKTKELEEERIALEQEAIVAALKKNVILLKGADDIIFAEHLYTVTGGSLRATVAGTGDVLAGICASFRAQGLKPKNAALATSVVAKRAAEILESRKHYSFIASDYLDVLPDVLKELKIFRTVKHT